MGGGHVSRPDFGMPQPDPAHPLTEFYCLLQRALDREGVFALPALYAQFRAPARRIYADEAADFLTLLPDEEEGASRLLAPAQLQLLYSSLHVMRDGAPAALLLTERYEVDADTARKDAGRWIASLAECGIVEE